MSTSSPKDNSLKKPVHDVLNDFERLYGYEPLPDENHIRILELKAGRLPTLPSFSLHVVDIHEEPRSWQYEAISYNWGDLRAVLPHEGKRVCIPTNLLDALYSLRQPESSRFLWADSLCVNQNDNKEKASQVALMGRIFSEAKRVLIWLGVDPEGYASNAFDLARRIAMLQVPDFPLRVDAANLKHYSQCVSLAEWIQQVRVMRHKRVQELSASERVCWNGLARVLQRPWFARVWVIQEVGLSASATVLCGTSTIEWLDLVYAMHCVTILASELVLDLGMQSRANLVVYNYGVYAQMGCFPGFPDFLDALDMVRDFQCADPRDRVYALLSHRSAKGKDEKMLLLPDYGISMTELNLEVATRSVEEHGSLKILSHVFKFSPDVLDGENTGSPSWVPRWEEKRLMYVLWSSRPDMHLLYSAHADTKPEHALVKDKKWLKVTGILLDTTHKRSETIDPAYFETSAIRNPYIELLYLLISHESKSRKRYPTDRSWFEAIMRTMCHPNEGMNTIVAAEFERWRSNHSTDPTMESNFTTLLDTSNFPDLLMAQVMHRKLFVTADGRAGAGPSAMQDGDLICILFGCNVPFLLRKHGDMYKLVGECYVHGVMKGEAIAALREGNIRSQEFVLC